jgi:predicted transcriptional regulator
LSRRNLPQQFEDLLKAIPVNSMLPITTIAYKANMDVRLARKLLKIAIRIQSEAPIVEEKIGEKTEAYHKETRAGRPKKE